MTSYSDVKDQVTDSLLLIYTTMVRNPVVPQLHTPYVFDPLANLPSQKYSRLEQTAKKTRTNQAPRINQAIKIRTFARRAV